MKTRNGIMNWFLGLLLILPLGVSANVLVQWKTIELGPGVNSVESMWEVTDAAAARWFAFNPEDVIDFYFKVDTDHGVYHFTDENMTRQFGGAKRYFHIQFQSDLQLHTPNDVGFTTTDGHTIGWYSDPMAEQGPTEYASYVGFAFHDGGDYGYSATGQWNVVPEPPIYALMLVGLIGVGIARRLKAQA